MGEKRILEPSEVITLPHRAFSLPDGTELAGYYDESTSYIYIPNGEEGGYPFEIQEITEVPEESQSQPTFSEPDPPTWTVPPVESGGKSGKKRKERKKQPKNNSPGEKKPIPKLAFIIGLVAIVLVLIFTFITLCLGDAANEDQGKEEQTQSEVKDGKEGDAENEDSEDADDGKQLASASEDGGERVNLDKIKVIQIKRDIIPGEYISTEDMQMVTISAETYNTICLCGSDIFQWSSADGILNATPCATTFINAGTYLGLDNVAEEYKIHTNPWKKGLPSGYVPVVVPLTEEALETGLIDYGTVCNFTIEKRTVSRDGENELPEAAKITGMNHTNSLGDSVIIDKYTLDNVPVADLLNADGKSMYKATTCYTGIPAGVQIAYFTQVVKANPGFPDAFTPAYIEIMLSEDQAEALGDLTADDTDVEIAVTEDIDKATDSRSVFADASRELKANIEVAVQLVEEAS